LFIDLYVGGEFNMTATTLEDLELNNIAQYNTIQKTWTPLGNVCNYL
jgi:hypothetical protein